MQTTVDLVVYKVNYDFSSGKFNKNLKYFSGARVCYHNMNTKYFCHLYECKKVFLSDDNVNMNFKKHT